MTGYGRGVGWEIDAAAPQAPRVAEVLAAAFAEVPLTRWVLRDPRDLVKVRSYVAILVATSGPGSLAFCEREGRGAAVWVQPGRWRNGFMRRARHVPALLGLTGLARAPGRFFQLSRVARDHPPEPHYYLELVGVRPDTRGAGLGDALVRAGLALADAEGVAAHLHTSNRRAIPLYERCGFSVSGELQLGASGPLVWAMRREPAAKSA